MTSFLLRIWKTSELRNKILFVLAVFIVFRVAANIPVPGIDAQELAKFFQGNQFFGLLNIFSGGALSNLSLAMLGLGPYITSTIILQLMTMVFPALKELYQESGEQGRQKFNQYGRLLTVPLAALQGYGLITLFSRQGIISSLTPLEFFTTIAVVTAGALFLMWLGEIISEKGVGNGISLLIFAGIVAGVPNALQRLMASGSGEQIPSYVIFALLSVFIVMSVVVINEARRNIPVTYARRVQGSKMYGGMTTFLPLSINPAGVIPIIFALSILLFPSMIGNFLIHSPVAIVASIANAVVQFSNGTLGYSIAYFVLVIVFTYFYTAVTFDPKNIATNLQKQGGFVPGIRPGASTAAHISHILNRTLLVGAIFLGVIAVLPSFVQGATNVQAFQFLVGGTSVLIVVSVVLETMRQIQAQIAMREYDKT